MNGVRLAPERPDGLSAVRAPHKDGNRDERQADESKIQTRTQIATCFFFILLAVRKTDSATQTLKNTGSLKRMLGGFWR